MNRAYSTITVRSATDSGGERIIEGVATTPKTDRVGDVVEPLGAKFTLPLPLLWQHNHSQPIGHVEQATPSANGISFRARLVKVTEPGTLKDRLDEAWQSIKTQLVRAVSIGFRPITWEPLPAGGVRYLEWDWFELSAVTIPAQEEATIQTIKRYDLGRPPAGRVVRLGARKEVRVVRLDTPITRAIEVAMADDPKDSVVGYVGAIVGAGFGATERELQAVRDRLDRLENDKR